MNENFERIWNVEVTKVESKLIVFKDGGSMWLKKIKEFAEKHKN